MYAYIRSLIESWILYLLSDFLPEGSEVFSPLSFRGGDPTNPDNWSASFRIPHPLGWYEARVGQVFTRKGDGQIGRYGRGLCLHPVTYTGAASFSSASEAWSMQRISYEAWSAAREAARAQHASFARFEGILPALLFPFSESNNGLLLSARRQCVESCRDEQCDGCGSWGSALYVRSETTKEEVETMRGWPSPYPIVQLYVEGNVEPALLRELLSLPCMQEVEYVCAERQRSVDSASVIASALPASAISFRFHVQEGQESVLKALEGVKAKLLHLAFYADGITPEMVAMIGSFNCTRYLEGLVVQGGGEGRDLVAPLWGRLLRLEEIYFWYDDILTRPKD